MQNQNVFKKATSVLYGSKRKEEMEQKNLRNSLLNELGDKLTPSQILYSSVDDLKKMKEVRDLKTTTTNRTKEIATGFALPLDGKNPNMTLTKVLIQDKNI